jgi:hypothetical protein
MEAGAAIVGYDSPDARVISKRLDCGIAMLHFELGALKSGVPGAWEPLDDPDVARFTPADQLLP